MSRLSWSDWVRHERGADLGLAAVGMAARFALKRPTYLLGRESLTVRQGQAWLAGALAGTAPVVGALPAAAASLAPTRAPALARAGNTQPAAGYVLKTERPATGFRFVTDASVVVPETLTVSSQLVRPANLVGIDLPTGKSRIGEPAPAGVFLGRLSRRAWISGVRYEPKEELFFVNLRLERADPYELELEVREYVDGDLADLRRLRLADIRLPAAVKKRLTVRLPTLGRHLTRTINLYGRGGELLDERVGFNIVESVHFAIAVNGSPGPTITVGEKRTAPLASERLADVARVEQQYEWWLDNGARRRLINGVDASKLLARRLRRASGELLIIDPYFGVNPTDWDLLKSLTLPVRILTGSWAKPAAQPLANIQARKWTKGPPPYHDRFYVWGGGGLNVGASPGGLNGHRAFRIDELSEAEMRAIRTVFADWWGDAAAKPL